MDLDNPKDEERLHRYYLQAYKARNPFQFLATCQLITNFNKGEEEGIFYLKRFPHQLDASASAYQLISYFLIKLDMAVYTNLIKENPDSGIQDIYTIIQSDLLLFLYNKHGKNTSLFNTVYKYFDRSIVKKIFMPIVYGKTIFSTSNDIKDKIGNILLPAEVREITSICFEYWGKAFSAMKTLMSLVSSVSWVASGNEEPVKYSTKYWVTQQDYFDYKPVRITLSYKTLDPKPKTKRALVTLRIPTTTRNTRKSASSTFANFIHQKDGLTAINFIEMMMNLRLNNLDFSKAPIYTVHDNFITTGLYANYMPYIYRKSFIKMGHPLIIINKLIYDNIIAPCQLEDIPEQIRDEFERITKDYNCNEPTSEAPFSKQILSCCIFNIAKNAKAFSRKDSKGENKTIRKPTWVKKTKVIIDNYESLVGYYTSSEGVYSWGVLSNSLDSDYDPNVTEYSLHY